MSGWWKHDRDMFSRPWAKDPKTVSVYEYLHCVAYVCDGMLHGQRIRRGSCPTSRAAIMEATGLSAQEVRTRLRKLLEAGDIIVKPTNFGNIVTACDYCMFDATNDLFELNSTNGEQPQQPTGNNPTNNPSNQPLYIKEDRIQNSLITPFSPYKTEREKQDEALEIKKLYNKTFDGILRKWDRLSADMRIKVNTCITRYGRQSVDIVFDQVKHEKFSCGDNETGFIADFAFIFKLANYEAYLGRYQLRMKKNQKKQETDPESGNRTFSDPGTQKVANGSWLDAYNEDKNWKPNIKK